MKHRMSAMVSGMHFRFLCLVLGVAALLLAAQLFTDTSSEIAHKRQQRIDAALGVTNVIARSLEKQFNHFDLDDIESILVSVRKRGDIRQLSVVDRDKTFFLDGDLATSPVIAVDSSVLHDQALSTGKTALHVGDGRIEVAEPLLAGAGPAGGNGFAVSAGEPQAIGSVLIAFENPGLVETLVPVIRSKLATILPTLLIGLVLAARMVSQITAPLKGLTQTAKAIADGDLEREAEGRGALEIRQLADSFNQMVRTIRTNMSQIYDLAYVDKITRLPNREFFRREIARSVAQVERNGTSGALLFLDLDGFKRVNDTSGHDLGDQLLAAFAERISGLVRQGDQISLEAAQDLQEIHAEDCDRQDNTFARLGGDEFTILLPEIREETDAATVARRILQALREPFVIDGKEINIGASIGIATFPRDGKDYQTLLKHSDMAMYQAKEEGKNTYRFFSEELNHQAGRRMEIETDLRKALQKGELELYYQPKVDARSGAVYGVEGLLRWHHPGKGMVSPGEFIPVAEDCGLIQPLGDHVIETACRQIAAFCAGGRPVPVAVNISIQQFEKVDFASNVKSILKRTKADPSLLELEVTESMAMSNPALALEHIQTLKEIGVRFAIDDFGTGYSNLAQLSRLPFDVFKIDRSFVSTLDDAGGHGETIVRTIIAMAHSMNYTTVAEGVETEEQLDKLVSAGCHAMQGFLFAKPMAIGDLEAWLEGRQLVAQTKATRAKAA